MKTASFFNDIPILDLNFLDLMKLVKNFDQFDPTHWHFAAGSTFVEAHKNDFLESILVDGQVFCDSFPVAKFLKWTGSKVDQVRGTDFLNFAISNGMKGKHFFLGGHSESLNLLVTKVVTENQDFKIVGTSDARISLNTQGYGIPIDLIRSSKANIIWICLGSPKQDFVAAYLSLKLNLHCIAIGAALDFYSGFKRETPLILRLAGLEWFFRFLSEPKRLWRRYLFGNLALIKIMCINILKKL